MSHNLATRLFLPAPRRDGNAGIVPWQEIDNAAWIWHPDVPDDQPVLLNFRCSFAARREPLILHVSADERYELFLDGKRIARGPDRSDVQHWSYSSYRIKLAPGRHAIEALVWKIGPNAPMAQLSHRGGFILKAEGQYDALLTTGAAKWKVRALGGHQFRPMGDWAFIGSGAELLVDARELDQGGAYRPAEVVQPPLTEYAHRFGYHYGYSQPGWTLFPSTLPDQVDRTIRTGKAVAASDRPLPPGERLRAEDARHPSLPGWQLLLDGRRSLTIPEHSKAFLLWDLDDYYCAYPVLEISGGAGASVTWGWEESLFLDEANWNKGNRSEIIGKNVKCRGDCFTTDGRRRVFTTHWWRSGRYCLLNIETKSAPLTLHRVALNETRYPLEMEGAFRCSDADMPALVRLCLRGLQMCSHETFLDCPRYEQLMYVGDTRIQMLITYVVSRDDRLVRRGIELFDYSRVNRGFVNERYPSRDIQHCSPFALIWPLMLRDYAYWRNDLEWVRDRMIGLRAMFEQFQPYRNEDGLLEALPGWPFLDWVPEWKLGIPPDAAEGVSGPLNLFYILSLQAAADLERILGEPLLARRNYEQARDVARAAVGRFWDERRGLMSDNLAHTEFSEHSQCLALLTGAIAGGRAQRALRGLLTAPDLKRASCYFRFYLFEVLRRMGRAEPIIPGLEPWKQMLRSGFRTPPENGINSTRSDCHAWASHALFHLYTSIAGILPASPGFRTVRIEPKLGPWKELHCTMPHPDGEIAFDLVSTRAGWKTRVALPAGISGTLVFAGKQVPLHKRRLAFIL